MKRNRMFKFSDQIPFWIVAVVLLYGLGCSNGISRDYYQLKIYSIENEQQEDRMDQYLEKAYLPALHRAGIPAVGVFKPVEEDQNHGKRILVLIPFKTLDQFDGLPGLLKNDRIYQNEGLDYIGASYDNAPYNRIESILLRAFTGMPEHRIPEHSTAPSEQIYELRSYQGATEKIYETKVGMFNEEGELNLFIELGFQPVFFGEVISGADMPNLMYLTTFSDRASQEEHWKAFQGSPAWIKMKAMEKYQNTVSHSDKYILHPTGYSDL